MGTELKPKKATKTVRKWPAIPELALFQTKPLWDQDTLCVNVPTRVHGELMLFLNDSELQDLHAQSRKTHPTKITRNALYAYMHDKCLQPCKDDGVNIIGPKNDDGRSKLIGYWEWEPNSSSSVNCKNCTLDWKSHSVSVPHLRCQHFGDTLSACVSGFVTWLESFANRDVRITPKDLTSVGVPVLEEISKTPPRHKLFWTSGQWLGTMHKSCTFDKPQTMRIRDGYLVHTDKQQLYQVMLPLLLASPCACAADPNGPRQLVIMGQEEHIPWPANTVFIKSLFDLKQKNLRQQLKAPRVCVCITNHHVVHELTELCTKKKIGRSVDAKLTHKALRKKLKFGTILSDLRWDRVLYVTSAIDATMKVELPPGHDIGFYWTLCPPKDVVVKAPPLSTMSFTNFGIGADTDLHQQMNQHRMLDLSHIVQG